MVTFTHIKGLGTPPWQDETPARSLAWDYFLPDEPDAAAWWPLATVTCSQGHLASVSPAVHKIAADGTLSPSYVCPREGCTFHEFVRFEGWSEP